MSSTMMAALVDDPNQEEQPDQIYVLQRQQQRPNQIQQRSSMRVFWVLGVVCVLIAVLGGKFDSMNLGFRNGNGNGNGNGIPKQNPPVLLPSKPFEQPPNHHPKPILKLRWPGGIPKPTHITFALTNTWGFFLSNKVDHIRGLPDLVVHGLWDQDRLPPRSFFNLAKVTPEQLRKAKQCWLNLNTLTDVGHKEFWAYEWDNHGRYLGFTQEAYMDITLHLYSLYADVLKQVLSRAKKVDFDMELGGYHSKASVSAIESTIRREMKAKPFIQWKSVDKNNRRYYVLTGIHFNVSLLQAEDGVFELVNMLLSSSSPRGDLRIGN